MKSALFTRITPAGHVFLTRAIGTVFGGNEDLATAEQAGIDGEGAGPKKAEPGRGRQADDRGDAVETRQHGRTEWHEQHEGIAQATSVLQTGVKIPTVNATPQTTNTAAGIAARRSVFIAATTSQACVATVMPTVPRSNRRPRPAQWPG